MDKNKILKLLLFIFAPLLILLLFVVLWMRKSDATPGPISENTANKIVEQVANKPLPTLAKKGEKDEKLQRETDSFLPLFGNMPSVPVYVVDAPVLKAGTNVEHGVAYADCENKNVPTIFVKKGFYQKANQKMLVNILKHELTHAYFCRQGIQAGHDERWRKKFTEVGGIGN